MKQCIFVRFPISSSTPAHAEVTPGDRRRPGSVRGPQAPACVEGLARAGPGLALCPQEPVSSGPGRRPQLTYPAVARWQSPIVPDSPGVPGWMQTDFPVPQGLGIYLPLQGTRVGPLVLEDPTCCGAAEPGAAPPEGCAPRVCAEQTKTPRPQINQKMNKRTRHIREAPFAREEPQDRLLSSDSRPCFPLLTQI